jgi:hypothetical protein
MNRNRFAAVAFQVFALIFAFAMPCRVQGQDNKNPYLAMAPLDQYLIDRDAEIALARTAAPEAISRDAKVLVLGRHGYETAVEGKNGFVCLVERSWMATFDDREFWNPKIRSPLCVNPPAARSLVLAITTKRTELILALRSNAQVMDWFKDAYAKRELPPFETGSMSYMMSKQAYLNDMGSHDLAHLMIYTPLIDGANWGADVPNSPIILGEQGPPEPYTMFIVPVDKWSDGTPAPLTQ